MTKACNKLVLACATAFVIQFSSTASAEWTYGQRIDKMRNTSTSYAVVISENKADFAFPYDGGSFASIALRKRPGEAAAVTFSVTKGHFNCAMGCEISAKFDDGRVERFSGIGTNNGAVDLIFIEPELRFINKLKASKKLIIEAPFYQEARTQFEFLVSGLNGEAIKAVGPAKGQKNGY